MHTQVIRRHRTDGIPNHRKHTKEGAHHAEERVAAEESPAAVRDPSTAPAHSEGFSVRKSWLAAWPPRLRFSTSVGGFTRLAPLCRACP